MSFRRRARFFNFARLSIDVVFKSDAETKGDIIIHLIQEMKSSKPTVGGTGGFKRKIVNGISENKANKIVATSAPPRPKFNITLGSPPPSVSVQQQQHLPRNTTCVRR